MILARSRSETTSVAVALERRMSAVSARISARSQNRNSAAQCCGGSSRLQSLLELVHEKAAGQHDAQCEATVSLSSVLHGLREAWQRW